MPALPSSLALTTIADGSQIVAVDHRNNYTAVQTGFNSLVGASGLAAAFTSYTPTWTCVTTPPALGDGTLLGKYWQLGKLVVAQMSLAPGASTTFGSGGFRFSLPVAITSVAATFAIGSGYVWDASATSAWTVTVVTLGTNTVGLYYTGGASAQVAATAPFPWAQFDNLHMTFAYEAA